MCYMYQYVFLFVCVLLRKKRNLLFAEFKKTIMKKIYISGIKEFSGTSIRTSLQQVHLGIKVKKHYYPEKHFHYLNRKEQQFDKKWQRLKVYYQNKQYSSTI